MRRLAFSLLILVCATTANAQPIQPADIGKSPLRFYVARGEEDACGLQCSEWIAVEGNFDVDSTARFRSFLARLGSRKLPVFFHSPGGLQSQALAIGRLLRERALTAAVARTLPEACATSDAAACDSAKKSGQPLSADWTSIGATCNSACVWALIGAPERRVPPGGNLGVHASKPLCVSKTGGIIDAKDGRCVASAAVSKAQLQRYFVQMGIAQSLIDLAGQIPYDRIRYLSREEIARFGIDRGEFQETRWMINQAKSPTAVKVVGQFTLPGGTAQFGAIELGCQTGGNILVAYYGPFAPANIDDLSVTALVGNRKYAFRPLNFVAWSGERNGVAPAGAISRVEFIDPGRSLYRHIVRIPHGIIDAYAPQLSIEVGDRKRPENSRTVVVQPSADGFDRAWKVASSTCGIVSQSN